MDAVCLITETLSKSDIQTIPGGYAQIIKHTARGNLCDIDQLLPDEKGYCIVLFEGRPYRGHWTALSKYNGLYEHFDLPWRQARW